MDTTQSPSPFTSFKSKKQLHLNSPAPSDEKARRVPAPEQSPWSVKTPGKPVDPPRRLRNRGAALSIKEVREAAMRIRQSRSDPPARIDPVVESVAEQASKPKKSSAEIKLPEKYELLDRFFNSLDSSIRLLQMKKYAPVFTKISPQIETLTDRRFTHNHLAQLKFIMPEAIVLDKVLRHDERTGCMKPDIRITLDAEAIESECMSKSLGRNQQLRKVFHGRLLEFFKSHPEGDEVPMEALPEPFNRLNANANANANSVQLSTSLSTGETPSSTPLERKPVTLSHTSPSFKSFFTKKDPNRLIESSKQDELVDLKDKSPESFKTENSSKVDAKPSSNLSNDPSAVTVLLSPFETPVKRINQSPSKTESYSKVDAEHSSNLSNDPSEATVLLSPFETPVKRINQSPLGTISALRTPVDPASSTPSLRPPKRCLMSPDGNDNDPYKSPNKLLRRPPPKRPLKFDTPVKNQKSSSLDDILDILPEALVESIQEKERLAEIERDPLISLAKWRRKMIANLPKRFDMIYYFFQSIRRSVVTKEELIQKMISGDLKVTDKMEIEEQLRLLQELAPEWIYEKTMSSGDLLVCVYKIMSPEAIRTRLSEAV